MNRNESAEQIALISWWRLQYPQWDLLLFHIPNGGLRSAITAARLKREGVKAGVADLFLAIASSGYHGFFIEMKQEHGGRQTDNQKQFQKAVEAMGYRYAVCHGWNNARKEIISYITKGNRIE